MNMLVILIYVVGVILDLFLSFFVIIIGFGMILFVVNLSLVFIIFEFVCD